MATIRVLALHGGGTSSQIFKTQLSALRRYLPSSWQFDYLNGEVASDPLDGIELTYPGPYFSYYLVPFTSDVADACELVSEKIAEDGPYDAILGFSQGASLAASVILHHQIEQPLETPLFRFAVFLNGTSPYSGSELAGRDLSALFLGSEKSCNGSVTIMPSDDDGISASQAPAPSDRSLDMQTCSSNIRRFSPDVDTARIHIPTAHVLGRGDRYYAQGIKLRALCNGAMVDTFEHGGGHKIAIKDAAGIAAVLMKTLDRANFMT